MRPGLRELLDEHPDIEFKLLLLVSDRLRHANAQILKVQRSNVDEKLKLMGARLDAEHMVFDAQLAAAGKVFDQTKTRVDDVITGAERSRDRLTKSAMLMGTFVTFAVGLPGLFGWSKVSDVDRARVEVAESAKKADDLKKEIERYRDEARKSTDEMKLLNAQAAEATEQAKRLLGGPMEELRGSMIEIYRARFFEALEKALDVEVLRQGKATVEAAAATQNL